MGFMAGGICRDRGPYCSGGSCSCGAAVFSTGWAATIRWMLLLLLLVNDDVVSMVLLSSVAVDYACE